MRMTIKNPNIGTYRAPLNKMGGIRIEWQQEIPVVYGSLVDLLGRYEDLGTPEEIREKLKQHKKGPG
jgi:hypothetical protein